MHDLRAPLNELLKKDKKWRWTPECQTAFDQIKKALTSDLFLTHYDPKLEIIGTSDASSYEVASCILHKMPDGTKKPIAHASRTLLPAEKHYSQIEKEALGIIFAVKNFHRYLHGRFFTLQTDHKPLITIFGSKKGLPIYTVNSLLRWGTILLNYNFKIEYLPSKQITHADGLSRLVPKCSEHFEDTIIAALRTDCEIKNMIANTIKELPMTLLEIKSGAMNDDFITNIKQKITGKNEKVPEVFSLCDNVLLYSERVLIPKKLQNRILRDFHTGHLGINRMESLMRSYVYWPKMDNDIRDMIEKCKGCA